MSITTSTFIVDLKNITKAVSTITQEVPFYPPDTISGKNAFVKLVAADVIQDTTTSDPGPFVLSCPDFPQSVGTYSTNTETDPQRSTVLGVFGYTKAFTPGASVLTYIPDGLRTIRLEISPLSNSPDLITSKFKFVFMLQFEVSGTR